MFYRVTLLASLLSSSALAGSTGTDSFGNTITGSDVNSSIHADLFFDISEIAPSLVTGDDVAAQAVELGTIFRFYGQEYDRLTFTTNGYVSTSETDTGPDFSNDPATPSPLSSGSGARIYAHHDDTEGTIYGAFFSANDNPFGVDAFIAQFDACHFNCSAGVDVTVQYNVALLADGTIIIAHNLAGPEQGSGATVGIQNETFDDGVAYLANEPGGIFDGQTIVVIPPESGMSADIQNLASEVGLQEAAAMAANLAAHLKGGQVSNIASQGVANPINRGFAQSLERFKPWVTAGAVRSSANDGDLESTSLFVQGGVDLYRTDRFVAGAGLTFSRGEADMGSATTDIGSETLFLYGATEVSGWDLSGMLSYGATHYENMETAFLGDIDADGERATISLAATKDFDIGNAMTLAPRFALLAGQEEIDDWATGDDLSRDVEDVSFYRAELTGKLSRGIDLFGGGTGYVVGGIDYFETTGGDEDIALFTSGYESERVGGVLGFGLEEMSFGAATLSADFMATAITDDSYTINGSLSLQF